MAQRLRKLQETFGRDMPSGESGVIGSKASGSPSTSKDVEILQSNGKYLLGFFETASDQGTTKLPYTEEMNSILYLITEQLKYLFQNGAPEYKDDEDYYPGISFCQDEGMIWVLDPGNSSPTTGFKPSTNQDKWNPVSAGTELISVSASGAVSLGYANFKIEVDVSVSDISISALPAPSFKGQKIHIYADGSGVCDIAGGNGVYLNGVFVTENTEGAMFEAVSVGGSLEWKASGGLSAKYLDVNWDVEQYSDGRMVIDGFDNGFIAPNLAFGSVYYINFNSTYPITFSTIPKVIPYGEQSGGVTWSSTASSIATTGHGGRAIGANNTTSMRPFSRSTGVY